jgi:RNA methyltransferase, TrmH family
MTSSRITSRQNPRVKDAVRLRTSRGRQRQRRIIVDGAREILRAVDSGVRCVEAFVCEKLNESVEAAHAVTAVRSSGAEMFVVPPDVYEKLAFGDRDDGIIVVAETPKWHLADLRLPAEPLVAVLEGIEKPGNLGAILRSADAAGVDAVIVADGRSDLFNPNTIRASLGTVFRPNVCEATSAETVAYLGKNKLKIFAARPDADTCYTETDFRGGVAIVLGSEAAGLSDAWRSANVVAIHLPMHGMADSLNVSTTAAVLFYEALRQRSMATGIHVQSASGKAPDSLQLE